jgi:SOS response regulatory protein OraA/RecX
MSLISLQNYGEWYYTRYFPSVCVLREKILKKSHDDESLTNDVMIRLNPLFVEKNIIESRVHEYIWKGKTPYYIRQKLLQKKFESSLLAEVLRDFWEVLEDPETYRKIIQDRCHKAAKKWFSRKRIAYELQWQYPQAHYIIWEILEAYDEWEILREKVLPNLIKKYPEEKIIQKCIQAGFSAQDARLILREISS